MYRKGIYDVSPDAFERYKEAYKGILSKRYFEILSKRAGKKMDYSHIAKEYGISVTRIRQICATAKERIEQARYPTE